MGNKPNKVIKGWVWQVFKCANCVAEVRALVKGRLGGPARWTCKNCEHVNRWKISNEKAP